MKSWYGNGTKTSHMWSIDYKSIRTGGILSFMTSFSATFSAVKYRISAGLFGYNNI